MKPSYLLTRKERRAAAHAAATAAAQQPSTTPAPTAEPEAPTPETSPKKEISQAQLEANRRNAHLSHGPTSEAGRQKVSMNALKFGLTGAQVLLPTDDAALYEAHVRDYKNEFQPVGPEETHLLQSIIDTRWRLARIPGLELALLDLARRQLIKAEPGLADNPSPVLEMQARIHLQKDLRNLHLQENRLVRRREREMKELRELQATRKAAEKTQGKKAEPATSAKQENGIVFPPPLMDEFLAMLTPKTRAEFIKGMQESASETGEALEAAA